MLSAEYFCSGSVSKESYGHYGLASPIYTHFTVSLFHKFPNIYADQSLWQSPIRRYADVLAHRQLAAAINYTPLHPSLQSKSHVERILSTVNKRHRLAQMAGRASVEFYVSLTLKGKGTGEEIGVRRKEEAWVVRTFKNGLAVFVPKWVFLFCFCLRPCLFLQWTDFVFRLGLEGLVTFQKELHTYDAENYTISISSSSGEVVVAVFDKIMVDISIEKDENTQRGKVKMVMVEPVDSDTL